MIKNWEKMVFISTFICCLTLLNSCCCCGDSEIMDDNDTNTQTTQPKPSEELEIFTGPKSETKKYSKTYKSKIGPIAHEMTLTRNYKKADGEYNIYDQDGTMQESYYIDGKFISDDQIEGMLGDQMSNGLSYNFLCNTTEEQISCKLTETNSKNVLNIDIQQVNITYPDNFTTVYKGDIGPYKGINVSLHKDGDIIMGNFKDSKGNTIYFWDGTEGDGNFSMDAYNIETSDRIGNFVGYITKEEMGGEFTPVNGNAIQFELKADSNITPTGLITAPSMPMVFSYGYPLNINGKDVTVNIYRPDSSGLKANIMYYDDQKNDYVTIDFDGTLEDTGYFSAFTKMDSHPFFDGYIEGVIFEDKVIGSWFNSKNQTSDNFFQYPADPEGCSN